MRNPGGYSIWVDPETATVERDTFTCSHCGGVTFVDPFVNPRDLGGGCRSCMGLLCPKCYDLRSNGGPCVPWEKQMEIMEEREASRRTLGVMDT
jgi:hypothetical protein